MHNQATFMPKSAQSLSSVAKTLSFKGSISFLLTIGLTAGLAIKAHAQSPETAPPQIKEALAQIDAAANRRDVQAVMQFYSANFRNSDGLNRSALEKALSDLWKRYPQLNYRTEIKDWKQEGNGIVAETVTSITGTQQTNGMTMRLESSLRSRQRFENQRIVQQDILGETTKQMSGANPPTIDVKLPEQVRIGQQFNFDVIVKEPLGNDLLLGAALEEPTKPDLYSKPSKFDLDLLPAGGIFKVGKAPMKPANHWISAVLIREGGITMITQRLQIVDRPSASRAPAK